MGSETTPEMLAVARRWMGKLPRNEFDHLLLLVAEAREDGSRTATELAAKLADQRAKFWRDAAAMNLPVCPSPVIGNDRAEKIASIATALRNGEHYHDR